MNARTKCTSMLVYVLVAVLGVGVRECEGQGAGAFDLGDHREGQLSGQISPMNVFAIVLGCLAAFVACGVTGVCAYFTWKRYNDERGHRPGAYKYSDTYAYSDKPTPRNTRIV